MKKVRAKQVQEVHQIQPLLPKLAPGWRAADIATKPDGWGPQVLYESGPGGCCGFSRRLWLL